MRLLNNFTFLTALLETPNTYRFRKSRCFCVSTFGRGREHNYCLNVHELCEQGRFMEALQIFHEMKRSGVVVDSNTYTSLLQGCINLKALDQGKLIHEHMKSTGFEATLFQMNCLVNMYVKCRSLENARKVFDEIPHRNAVSWSAMMAGYVQQGHEDEALELFRAMARTSMEVSCFALGSAMRACANLQVNGLDMGQQLHTHIIKTGFYWNDVLSNVLVHMYAECGSMVDARQVFDKMPQRNSISFNAMISVSSQHERNDDALKLFCEMQQLGMKPNHFTFASVITACAAESTREQGKQVHVQAMKIGCTSNVFVGSALVNMYAKCRTPNSARKVFDRMLDRNVVSWTAMMVGYVLNNFGEEAIEIFVEMQRAGINPNYNSFAIVLSACANIEALFQGTQIHAHAVKTGFESDVSLGNGLVNMYAKCRNIEAARREFDLMSQLDLISWNAIICGYTQNETHDEAVKLFTVLLQDGLKPDCVTLISVLSSCANLNSLEIGKQIHAFVFTCGLELNVSVGNALITSYAKCRSIVQSRQVFERMNKKDLVSWNAIIGGYAQNELTSEAIELFQYMQKTNVPMNDVTFVSILSVLICPETLDFGKEIHSHVICSGFEKDICVKNSLVTMYAKSGRMEEASKMFNKMEKPDLVSWNTMISGYALNEHSEEALNFVCKMQEKGLKLDHFTFATVLRACASVAALENGEEIHGNIIRAGFDSDIVVGSALVDMYAKCGSIEGARSVFDKMAVRNDVSWNAMISGYARHGDAKEALQHFDLMQMEGLKPSHITFVGVLSACSHAGLVDKGRKYFVSMNSIYGVAPKLEHYACIVDLLGRAGSLVEAEDFINRMPVQPNAFIWRTLLGACRVYGNMEIGKRAADCLLNLEPQDSATYVLLSNIYASAGKWDDAIKVRTMMKGRRVKKDPGWSWIKLKSEVHGFLVGDSSHPQTEEIYAKLASLSEQMKEIGYIPNTNFTLHDVEQEQKEHFLSYHSEKLAIAYGLICTPAGVPIRVIKNLRVCGDCHSAIKLISKIEGRKIVVRDSNRYHHFINGLCSCGDYW
ncbi:putative pentatricopeptide repeat-containing protein At5g09950 [Cryptomeria japonica]|uniref:putative pentatricopeptide repeat-containing protein At5g09950 n=1 Tax=Cryptomeria japonica TaxID=3369 RepID=UPI0027D9EE7B|nr:putative pentatricopeptide repeat-containing protein At5g09950 [Cryptomeria japonica]